MSGKLTSTRAIAIVVLGVSAGLSQERTPEWRFWTHADGLTESCVRSVTSAPDGKIWLRHGAVNSMSVLDGYRVVRLPEMRNGSITDWGLRSRAYGAKSGEGWAVENGELRRYRAGRWDVEVGKNDAGEILAATPAGSHMVLVLFADHLAIYDPAQRAWKVIRRREETRLGDFLQIVPGFADDFWITGTTGVARLELPDGAIAGRWTERDTTGIGMRGINYPLPSGRQEVFVSGRMSKGTGWAVARWNGREFGIVHTSSHDNVRGWRGPDGELWFLDGASLFRLTGGRLQPIPMRDSLAGTIFDVLSERDGTFWVAGLEGLAHYTAPLWRTPVEVTDLDAAVHSITEDRQGRLWFAATEYLLELDGITWRRHRLPFGALSHTVQTHSLWPLPDGRIAIKVQGARQDEQVLLFDPASGKFQILEHPEGRTISLFTRRNDGAFWVVTKPGPRLEVYDGKTFRPQLDLTSLGQQTDEIRCVLESGDGALWISGSSGAAVWRGAARMLGAAEGFTRNGAYEIVELQPGRILVGGRDQLLEFDGRRWSELRAGLDRVRTILKAPDGILWVASGSGVHRQEEGRWITNGEAEGLPSNVAYTVFHDSRGRLWAGTSKGLSLYHREADRDAPRVRIEPAANARQATPDGDIRIVLSGDDKWKRTSPERLLYSSALDSAGWSPFAPEASATYNHLAPGGYQLRVRCMDRNGNIQTAADPFDFTVPLPWYRQAGFFLISFAGATVITILLAIAVANYRQRGSLILNLNEARLAAESASRHKSSFLANMSHEIRTPMNAVMGMTELALERAVEPEQRGYLETVQNAAHSLLALLNDILDFSKVEAGKLELVVVDFDLEEAISGVLRTLAIRAKEKGLELGSRVSPEVPRFLSGDDRRLQQVLLNLLGNSIKFASSGEIRVAVTLVSQSVDSVDLEFVVTDTGIGVRPEKHAAIFAPFEQADGSTTRKYGGTGLGLAICAKLVELMQGRIWIESPWLDSETGRQVEGSAFHFTARMAPGSAPISAQTAPIASPPKNLRILLAEDNAVNRLLAVRVLERRGHTVLAAENGREALQILEGEQFDAVLMDIQMPEMDGFEATSAIREKEKTSGGHLPIVALTANALQGDGERCLAHGMDAYLAKPFRIGDLDRVLGEVGAGKPGPCRETMIISEQAGPAAKPTEEKLAAANSASPPS